MDVKKVIYLLLIFVVALGGTVFGFAAGAFTVFKLIGDGNPAQEVSALATTTVSDDTAGSTAQEQPAQTIQYSNTDIETSITEAVEKVGPAVVTVIGTVSTYSNWLYQFSDQQVSGSGIVISSDGYILTNHHVIADMNDVSVILADGSDLPAEIINSDEFADLAIIKVDGVMPAVATLGNSDNLKPGETVIAIGSPLGSFKNSVTVGVISATGRSLDVGNSYVMEDMIQTDASINPGNSGGPLVNLAGEVIGVNTLVLREGGGTVAEGLGFAVPANLARLIAEQIMAEGYFARPNLGIRWQAITPVIAARYRLPVDYGAYVLEVQSGSAAEQAGIREQDIITCIGGSCIDSEKSYYNVLFENQPGDRVTVTLARGNEMLDLEVALGQSNP